MSFWRRELFHHPESAGARPLVATSACLLGEAVRYDGGHKLQPGIESYLAPYLQLQAVCPEVGIGLSIPRPALKVVKDAETTRVVGVEDAGVDVTASLRHYADQHLQQIGRFWPLCAWIFKARSPSCGRGSTPVNPGESTETTGSGAFAGHIAAAAPWLLLYEEEELQDEEQCTDMLLLSFLAGDILWQGGNDTAGLWRHYGQLLGWPTQNHEGGDRSGLWQKVRTELAGTANEKRRALVTQYRAA